VLARLSKNLIASLLLSFILLSLTSGYPKQTVPLPPEQLSLFHWWNAYPESERYGPDASRLPVNAGGYVWGRSGHEWVRSVLSYLEWREGSSWRNEYHRYHPVRWHYIECIRTVRSAYYSNVGWWSTAVPAEPTISREDKRPPGRVSVQLKKEGLA
jgi:hypothetical protein